MFTVKEMNVPYGLAITASHNPAIYNGIKVFTRGGRDADQIVTRKIEEQIELLKPEEVKIIPYEKALRDGRIREGYPFNEYIDGILGLVEVKKIQQARLRIALDPMYGVGHNCLRTILLTCRCDVDVIHEEHDTLFGGKMPAPSADALGMLSDYVVEKRCDFGLATDGDADRLGVVDEDGRYIHPNTLLVLLYYYLLRYRGWRGPCVRNNSTTHLLNRVAEDFGQICYEVPVGFKYISAKMTQSEAIIGGESSGGLAVRGHIAGKDGIYASILLVEMLAVTGKTVSQLKREIADKYGVLRYEEAAVTTASEEKTFLQKKVMELGELPDFGRDIQMVSREDGCKVYFTDGSWVICRFSGTEPLLRFAAESETREDAQKSDSGL